MITKIFNTLFHIDAKVKRAEVLADTDISLTVILDINGNHTKWCDNEKGFIAKDIYDKHFNGGLKDCLVYLETFCTVPVVTTERYTSRARVDLNEMYHEYTDNL